MMAVMMVVQLGFSSVLLGLVYAPNEVRMYVRHCQQDCFWCSGHHQISYCMCVHLHILILVLCTCVSVPLCMCTNPSICVHLCAMNIPYPLHCDWLAKVHVTSTSAHCSLQCSPYSLVSYCMYVHTGSCCHQTRADKFT